jgi:hypothetical protein
VTAVIVPRDGVDVSLEDVKELCTGKMAGYKIPKAIKLVERSRNETGKVIKRELRDRCTRPIMSNTEPSRDPDLCVITCALTGVLASRAQSPGIPYTPAEIGEEAGMPTRLAPRRCIHARVTTTARRPSRRKLSRVSKKRSGSGAR